MAIPGHKFVRAHFSNNERTIVESFWTDGKVTRPEYILKLKKAILTGKIY